MRPSRMSTDEVLQPVADQLETYVDRIPIWNSVLTVDPPSNVDTTKYSSSISVYSTATQSPECEDSMKGDDVEDVTVPESIDDTGNFPKSYPDYHRTYVMMQSRTFQEYKTMV